MYIRIKGKMEKKIIIILLQPQIENGFLYVFFLNTVHTDDTF